MSFLPIHCPKPYQMDLAPIPVIRAPSSIEFRRSISVCSRAGRLVRKICDLFRRVLSWFFPIKSYSPVSERQIASKRVEEGKQITSHILLDGETSKSYISYEKEGKTLVLTGLEFADRAVQEHRTKILKKVLAREGASGFSTNSFIFAKLLRDCGFFSKNTKIRYYPESEEIPQRLLGYLVDHAREKKTKGALLERGYKAFERVDIARKVCEFSLAEKAQNAAASLGLSTQVELHADFHLEDILTLVDAMGFDNLRGMVFECVRGSRARFTAI